MASFLFSFLFLISFFVYLFSPFLAPRVARMLNSIPLFIHLSLQKILMESSRVSSSPRAPSQHPPQPKPPKRRRGGGQEDGNDPSITTNL